MARPRVRAPRARLNIDISIPTQKQILRLERLLDAASTTETVRRAVDIAERVMQWQRQGGKIIMRRNDIEKELIIT